MCRNAKIRMIWDDQIDRDIITQIRYSHKKDKASKHLVYQNCSMMAHLTLFDIWGGGA